jgi:hypothetical protein
MINVKRAIIAMVAIFLLAGCTNEVKESKQESKQAIHTTQKIQKNQKVELTSSEKEYMVAIGKALGEFSERTTDIGSLMEQVKNNPSIVKDSQWMNQLQGDIMGIALMGEVLKEMDESGLVPERYLDLHSTIEDSFGLMVEGGNILVQAIKSNDMNLFNKSIDAMAQSNQKMIEVNEKLKELKSK